MPRPSNSTSAYESFPADEFDAWVDHIRDTIIHGLEEPELEYPTLSNGALEAVKQAEREAAEAEARAHEEARVREEEARQAAQRRLEEQRQMLSQLQQKKQQLEEQRQLLAREQERQEQQRQEEERQRQEEERQRQEEEQQRYEEEQRAEQRQREDVLRQRLQDARDRARQTQSQQGLMAQGEELEEGAEYEQDSGEAFDADQPEDDIFDDQASQYDQGRPYGYDEPTEDCENEPIDDREDGLFEDEQDPFEDEQPQFPTSPRPQPIYAEQQEASEQGDEEELFNDEDQQQQTMEVDEPSRYGSQSEEDGSAEQSDDEAQDRSSEQSRDQDAGSASDEDIRSASDEDVRSASEEDVRSASEEDAESASEQETASPQGFRRIYLPTHADERDASASQEGDYEQGEEFDDDRQDQVNSGSDTREVEYEGSERMDEAWQQDEQSRSRQPAQPASYPLPPNEFYGEDQNQVDSESDARQDESEESEGEGAGSEQDEQPQSRQLAEPASHPSPPIMSRGDASDAIEVIDSSDEENQPAPPRRSETSSAESEDDEEEAGSEPNAEDFGSDAASTQEREADAQGEQHSERDDDDENVSPNRYAVTGTQRPSDYDMDDDESERGYESDEEGADEGSEVQDQADQTEFEFAGRQSSEDELAEDDEDQRLDTEMGYAAYTDVGRPRAPRAISQRQSHSPIALDIDPSLQSEHTEVERSVQMVQVSSQSIVARGLLQMAHGTGSLASTILDDTTNDAATDPVAIGDAHVPSDALEADLPEGDDLRIQEPQSEMIDAQVQMVNVVAEAVEAKPSASRGAVGMEDAIPGSTSAPELPRSMILSDLPAALPTSASTEYEADNELLPEEAVSAAPSISTFSAIFADTPPHLSPTREPHAEYSAVENVEQGAESPAAEHAAPISQHEEEPRSQETIDIDVDAQAEDVSVRSIESDAEASQSTASTGDGDGSARSDASSECVSSQHSATDDITSPVMLETQETQEEIVPDDEQMIFEEQALHTADSVGSDKQHEVDGHKMRNVDLSRKQESGSPEPAQVDRTRSTSPAPASDQEGMETDLPQPEEIPSQHEIQEGRSTGNDTSDFDFHANVVRIQTPPDDQDELEDGEIRDSEDPVFLPRDANPACEREEAIGHSIENSGVEAEDAARIALPAQLEIEVEVDIGIEIDADDAPNDEGADERTTVSDTNEDNSGTLSETGNEDGISRGSADVMGSRLEGVRADEMEALEEDDEDSQINPDYDEDDTPSAEDIHYDSGDALPHSMTPEPEVTEADPDDPSALPREIRKHNRRDIPHKDEHLVEEDEEFNNDSPEHHIDGTPAGYETYPVEDETNSEEFKIFEMAERDPGGIEGDRTTEQVMIEEMELRQQPGDPTRAREELPFAESSTRKSGREAEIIPAEPSSAEFIQDTTPVADSLADVAKDAAVPSIDVMSPISEAVSRPQADSHVTITDSAKSVQNLTKAPEIQTVHSVDAETSAKEKDAEDEDMFHVQPSLQGESVPEHAAPASIVELLQSDELPQAPLHDRSPSPLAPEQELHHDIALAMEPAPLLHRHDHHHNVVVEESHKIHEEKRESFTSAIAAVQSTPSSSVEQSLGTQRESKGSSGEVDDTHVTTDGQAAPQGDMVVDDTDNLPTPLPAEAEQVEQTTQGAQPDDDDDRLRLSGPFNEQDSEPSPRMSGTEVYVEIPILDRSHSWHSERSGVRIEVEQHSTRPTTPVHPTPLSALSVDPTRHHHGPIHSASFSSIRSADLEISGSPAAHTRSQCHYHKIRFGRGVFSHVLLIPHCSIGTEEKRQQIGATDLGRVTKEEMLYKRDLDLGETFTSKMTSDVETLPDNLEHQVKQLAGAELLREGHIWLLPLADVAPQSVVNRTLQNAEVAQEDDVFHVRSSPRVSSSPRISNRVPSQTPDRKRKRASSRGRSTSATRSEGRSEGGSPESASLAIRSRSRAAIIRKVSQIDEKDEDAQELKEEGQAEGVDETMGDDSVGVSPKQEEGNAVEEGEPPIDTADKEDRSLVASPEAASDPARSEKRASDDMEVDEEEVGDDRASKKRIIEGEDGEGPEAVDVKPVEKTGWLSWIFGKR